MGAWENKCHISKDVKAQMIFWKLHVYKMSFCEIGHLFFPAPMIEEIFFGVITDY